MNVKVRWNFQSKEKTCYTTCFKDCASQMFVATILKTYVTILTKHDCLFKIRFELVSMTFALCFNVSLVKKLI